MSEVTCPICTKPFAGESNLKRHMSAMHKESKIKVISIPNDESKYNTELGIFEGPTVSFPDNFEFIAALPRSSMRQTRVDGKDFSSSCVDIIVKEISK